jgi:transposase InsO family protein
MPLPDTPSGVEASNIVGQHVDYVIASIPITDSTMQDIKSATTGDVTLPTVIAYCQSSWPDKPPSDAQLRLFWHVRDNLTTSNGIVLMDARVVIPEVLRPKMLTALHEGHQGIEKCRTKARNAIWWPKISAEIERFVTNCPTCSHWRQTPTEPLLPSELPAYPWQKVGTDLFELNGTHYIIVIDYYSRFIELVTLKNQTAESVINAMKTIFARHGIPMQCHSDNGPCYASEHFAQFARNYGFIHTTSSPHYARANGEAERAVRTVKDILRKSSDPHLALLAYRTTPLASGYSPSQLLMGRQLRSTVPTIIEQLAPKTVPYKEIKQRDDENKARQKLNHDQRHRARLHTPFVPGQRAYIPDQKSTGTIIRALPFRTYLLKTANGATVKRNAQNIRNALPISLTPHNAPTSFVNKQDRIRVAESSSNSAPPSPQSIQRSHPAINQQRVTRYGRQIKEPQRLNT